MSSSVDERLLDKNGGGPDLSLLSVTVLGVHYAPETTGNAPYTTALADALAAAGAQVRVITGVPHYPQWMVTDQKYTKGLRWRERLNGVDVLRVRHFVPSKPDLLGRAGLEATFFWQCVVAAARDRSEIFIAITPTLSGLAAAVLCRRGRPLGVLIQDLTGASATESGTSSQTVGRLIARVEYWLLKKADLVGVITPRFGQVLSANGVDAARVADLPNFTHVTPVHVTSAQARARLGWAHGYTVVHTGNMGMKQGLETVVASARLAEAKGADLQFVLVGDGNQRSQLRSLAGKCKNLHFVDPLDADDYPYALAAADILLVNERPGVKEMSLPSKLTSYSVAGRPIVAAVEPGGITSDTLERYDAAVLCQSGDPSALLDAVNVVRESSDRGRQLIDHAAQLHRDQYGSTAAYQRYCSFVATLALLCDQSAPSSDA